MNKLQEINIQNIISPREREVLLHIAKGMNSEEISKALYISKGTVETHRKNMMQKLGTNKVAQLIILAIHHKILEIDDNGEVRLSLP